MATDIPTFDDPANFKHALDRLSEGSMPDTIGRIIKTQQTIERMYDLALTAPPKPVTHEFVQQGLQDLADKLSQLINETEKRSKAHSLITVNLIAKLVNNGNLRHDEVISALEDAERMRGDTGAGDLIDVLLKAYRLNPAQGPSHDQAPDRSHLHIVPDDPDEPRE